MIDYERKDLRKVVKRKKIEERERTGRKEKQGCEPLSKLAHPLANAYAYQCGLGVRAHSAPSVSMHCDFQHQQLPPHQLRNRIHCGAGGLTLVII